MQCEMILRLPSFRGDVSADILAFGVTVLAEESGGGCLNCILLLVSQMSLSHRSIRPPNAYHAQNLLVGSKRTVSTHITF